MAPPVSKKKVKIPLSAVNLVKFETGPPSASPQRFDPLTAFKPTASRSTIGLGSSQNLTGASYKGKAKAKEASSLNSKQKNDQDDDRMWVDIYEPTAEAELAVHKRKVEDVRRWLQEAFDGGPALKKYRRILALTGPSGAGKTTTVRVLAREMGFDVMEWKNVIGESFRLSDEATDLNSDVEALFTKFEAFLNRASSCQNLFAAPKAGSASQSLQPPTSQRQIIMLEDLPNLLHPATQTQFHSAIQALVTRPVSNPPVPIIIVVSDTGARGEASDESITNGGGWGKVKEGIVDIRTVLPRDLLGGPYVTQIGFNPIAPTLLTKALQAMMAIHFLSSSRSPPTREVLDAIVESSNGDIRNAIMALQFACVVEVSGKARKKRGTEHDKTAVMESITKREQSLLLFHLLGKVLYNKRKGDPPSSSASAKDIQKEKLADAQLKDPPDLPPDFREHERRVSRINVDSLYAESPIDSSLFSLYIHQNYPQFCDDIEQCDGVADWLSWVDSSGGDTWYQANPHQFHLLTLGTIHSLPSPVARRSQKIMKPLFFECLQRGKDAWESVRDARTWVLGDGRSQSEQRSGWSHSQVAIELGGVLKARDQAAGGSSRPPASHRLFSSLTFSLGAPFGIAYSLDEKEVDLVRVDGEDDPGFQPRRDTDAEGGWLDSDDIEEF